jgi:hypothetical protein
MTTQPIVESGMTFGPFPEGCGVSPGSCRQEP